MHVVSQSILLYSMYSMDTVDKGMSHISDGTERDDSRRRHHPT